MLNLRRPLKYCRAGDALSQLVATTLKPIKLTDNLIKILFARSPTAQLPLAHSVVFGNEPFERYTPRLPRQSLVLTTP